MHTHTCIFFYMFMIIFLIKCSQEADNGIFLIDHAPSKMLELLTCIFCIYSLSLKLHKGFVIVLSFGIFCLGSKMEKVIFMYYFSFSLVNSCIWILCLAYGLWNDYGCPFPLSFVGYTESHQIKFVNISLVFYQSLL